MRVAAFVMTFDRPFQLGTTLRTLLTQTRPPDRILVVDNGTAPATLDVVRDIGDARLSYHRMPGNTGPAGAAAFGLASLAEQRFDWIYWGDDDDPPLTPDTLERLIGLASSGGDDVAIVAAFGQAWNWSTGRIMRLEDSRLVDGPVEVDIVPGNGQLLVSAEAMRRVGGADAALFFGLEDLDLSLRCRAAGMRLLVDGNLMREYRRIAGHLGPVARPIIAFRAPGTAWRDYYSTRNYIHMMSVKFRRPDLARRQAYRALARCALSWHRGMRYAWPYCGFTLRGILDGFRARLGCRVVPKRKYSLEGAVPPAIASSPSRGTAGASRPDREASPSPT